MGLLLADPPQRAVPATTQTVDAVDQGADGGYPCGFEPLSNAGAQPSVTVIADLHRLRQHGFQIGQQAQLPLHQLCTAFGALHFVAVALPVRLKLLLDAEVIQPIVGGEVFQ